MIDYIKFSVPATYRDNFLNNSKFEFKDEYNIITGEPKGFPKCEFMGMKIEIFKKEISIHGSIHKFYNRMSNGSNQNYNQLTHSMLSQAIKILLGELGINEEDTEVHNLEFGINITVKQIPQEFLSSNIIMLKYRRPSRINKFDGAGYFTEYTLGHYFIKVYAKSLQFNLDTPVIRMEVKTRKMKHILKANIKLLPDLLDKGKLNTLKGILMKHISNLLIVDTLDFSRIKDDSDREFVQKYSNPQQLNRKEKREKKYIYDRLINKLERYGLLNLKAEIMSKVSIGWDQCMNDESQFEIPPRPLSDRGFVIAPKHGKIHLYI